MKQHYFNPTNAISVFYSFPSSASPPEETCIWRCRGYYISDLQLILVRKR